MGRRREMGVTQTKDGTRNALRNGTQRRKEGCVGETKNDSGWTLAQT